MPMILEDETFRKFGYLPSSLAPQSHKKILVRCDDCGKTRETSKHDYRALCRSCSLKCQNRPNWKRKSSKIKRLCKECGKELEVYPSVAESGGGLFCSISCALKNHRGAEGHNWKGGKKKQTCQTCGKEFEVHPSEIARGYGRSCSLSCARKANKPQKHHTKPELIFKEICKRNNLPFHFVGDGSLWIGKKGERQLNPDFIEANGNKICVEVMGDYWHSPLLNRKIKGYATLKYRKKHFKRFKWHPIFIWESDLKRADAEAFVLNLLDREGLR